MKRSRNQLPNTLSVLHACIAEVGTYEALMAVAAHVINNTDNPSELEIGAELVEIAVKLRPSPVGVREPSVNDEDKS